MLFFFIWSVYRRASGGNIFAGNFVSVIFLFSNCCRSMLCHRNIICGVRSDLQGLQPDNSKITSTNKKYENANENTRWSWFQQLRARVTTLADKIENIKCESKSYVDDKCTSTPKTSLTNKNDVDETFSNMSKVKVATAKQYIENHYKTQMKFLQERKER